MLLLAAHGFERPIYCRVDLPSRIALPFNLLSCRSKVLVELLEERRTLATLGEAHRFEAQLSLRKGGLQHALLSDAKLLPKYSARMVICPPQRGLITRVIRFR